MISTENKMFESLMLKNAREEAKEILTKETLKKIWVYKWGRGKFEGHCNVCEQFPEGHYSTISAETVSGAKSLLIGQLIYKILPESN